MKKKSKQSKNKKTAAKKVSRKRRTSQKIKSAARHIKTVTKKLVDDSFLKSLGMKVLVQAQEITKTLHTEKKAKKARK